MATSDTEQNKLEQLRQSIDACDRQLAALFEERMQLVLGVADYKLENGLAIFDSAREKQILQAAAEKYGSQFPREMQQFFRSMMRVSRALQARKLFPYNIVLIGFMGTGKSTVGQILADHLGRRFVDLDAQLEREQRTTIAEIFRSQGENVFRQLEQEMIAKYSGEGERVLSCGGGAVLRKDNVDLLRSSGCLVLLEADPDTIYKRVRRSQERPLLNGDMTPRAIGERLAERAEAYSKAADIRIWTEGKAPADVADEIVRQLCEKAALDDDFR